MRSPPRVQLGYHIGAVAPRFHGEVPTNRNTHTVKGIAMESRLERIFEKKRGKRRRRLVRASRCVRADCNLQAVYAALDALHSSCPYHQATKTGKNAYDEREVFAYA